MNQPGPNNNHLLAAIKLREYRSRSVISSAKLPLLSAVIRIVEENRSYWPLSVRQIHYRLLKPAADHDRKDDQRAVWPLC